MIVRVTATALLIWLFAAPAWAAGLDAQFSSTSGFSWLRYFASFLLCILLAGIAVIGIHLARKGVSPFDWRAQARTLRTLVSRIGHIAEDQTGDRLSVLDQKRLSPTTTATVLRCGRGCFLVIQGPNGHLLLQDVSACFEASSPSEPA